MKWRMNKGRTPLCVSVFLILHLSVSVSLSVLVSLPPYASLFPVIRSHYMEVFFSPSFPRC